MKKVFVKHFLIAVFAVSAAFSVQAIFAQDKVHLKEDYSFKKDGETVYQGKADEAFRLREISNKSLKIELPDASIVEIAAKKVLEEKDRMIVMQKCNVFSESKMSFKELTDKNKGYIIETLTAGTVVQQKKTLVHELLAREYRIETPEGQIGWVDAACVRNDLRYLIALDSKDIYLFNVKDPHSVDIPENSEQARTKIGNAPRNAFFAEGGEKFIIIDMNKPYVKLRTSDGKEGWARSRDLKVYTDDEYTSISFYSNWLDSKLVQLCAWTEKGTFQKIVVLLIYAILLFIYAWVPIHLFYYPFILIKWLPNFVCKMMYWTFPMPFFFLSGMDLIKYAPLNYNVPMMLLAYFWVLCLIWGNLKSCNATIDSQRCSKCKTMWDNTITDERSSSSSETTTTT